MRLSLTMCLLYAKGLVSCELVSCELVSCELVSCELVSCELVSCELVSCELVFAEEEFYFKSVGVLVLGDWMSGMRQRSGHSFYWPTVAANTRSGRLSR